MAIGFGTPFADSPNVTGLATDAGRVTRCVNPRKNTWVRLRFRTSTMLLAVESASWNA